MGSHSMIIFCSLLSAVFAAPNAVIDENDDFDVRQLFVGPLPNINITDVIERYACFVNVADSVTNAAGMTDIWGKFGPLFATNIEKWGKCGKNPLIPTHLMCHVTQGIGAYNLILEYLAAVMAKDPNFTAQLFTEFSKQCTIVPPSFYKKTAQDVNNQSTLDYVKCVLGAVTDAIDGTQYEQLWSKYLTQLQKKLENLYNCGNQGSPIDVAKCVLTELQGVADLLREFFDKLSAVNQDTLNKIQKYIQERCSNISYKHRLDLFT